MSDDDRGGVSGKEKDLAAEALVHFNNNEYSSCLASLEQLEILRPSDVKLAHNKIVAQCRAEGSPVQLTEVQQQLEGLAKTAGLYYIFVNMAMSLKIKKIEKYSFYNI